MQTFLPYADFPGSAKVLDRKRLGKQRVECCQILNTLLGYSAGWQNHPAVKMWRGYEYALCDYGIRICREWIDRGYNDNCMSELKLDLEVVKMRGGELKLPPWYSNHLFHASHRANLLRKDFAHYSQFGWVEDPTMPYYWPEV